MAKQIRDDDFVEFKRTTPWYFSDSEFKQINETLTNIQRIYPINRGVIYE